MLQKFIEAGGKDVRAWVVGNKVVLAMERSAKGKEFRANISKGGSGKKVTLTATEEKFCVDASKAIGLNFSGVDIIRGNDGVTYCIEINGNSGTRIIEITGYNPFIDLVKYCEDNYKKGGTINNDSTKANLANIMSSFYF